MSESKAAKVPLTVFSAIVSLTNPAKKEDEKMAVFDVLPGNFFTVLVSTNREIYVEALLLLYFDYIYKMRKQDELVIYHGGQYSPAKRVFLQAVADASAKMPWFHWGILITVDSVCLCGFAEK